MKTIFATFHLTWLPAMYFFSALRMQHNPVNRSVADSDCERHVSQQIKKPKMIPTPICIVPYSFRPASWCTCYWAASWRFFLSSAWASFRSTILDAKLLLYVWSGIGRQSLSNSHIKFIEFLTEIVSVRFPMNHNILKTGARYEEHWQKANETKTLASWPIIPNIY